MKLTHKHLHHEHLPDKIRQRLKQDKKTNFSRDFVYGATDGIVTTFAIVSSVIAAELPASVIFILGGANLLADGFSMAAGNYLATKTEHDEYDFLKDFEYQQILKNPEGETEEVRQILINKGLSGETLATAVATITTDKKRWVELMLAEEYGLAAPPRVAFKAATITFTAFLLFGSIPLIPFLFSTQAVFLKTCIFSGLAFFALGSLKSQFSQKSALVSGSHTLLIGSTAAALAYAVGAFLKSFI